MVEVVKFQASHVLRLKMQEKQHLELKDLPYEYYVSAQNLKHSYTIMIGEQPYACVGVSPYWKNRGEVWAIIDREVGYFFLAIIRKMKELLAAVDLDRIEATIEKDFKQGHRLAKLMGFELEAETMRKYGENGLDYSLYARVK